MSSPPAYYQDEQVTLLLGDALEQLRTLPDGSVDCIVTSPPYFGLRDYGTPGQYGLEATPAEYVETMRALFAEARRVLADDGTLWLNLGDSYAYPPGSAGRQGATGQRADRTFTAEGLRGTRALPPKNLLMIPARVAIALQDDGWILRNENVWWKRNGMPEKAQDRLTSRHEKVYLLAKQQDYWFDLDAVRLPITAERARHDRNAHLHDHRYAAEGTNHGIGPTTLHRTSNPLGSNPGDVWDIPTRPYPAAHFATFPIDLPLRCIKAGCKPGGTVLDPFSGSGTTGAAARQLGRKYVGIDLNPAYHDLAKDRFVQGVLDFGAA
ncbi:DNA-methyltransferase [Streptomyces sp. NRRL S-813]|uniref:DNA-methyltransferase n=1 Tax=Streptomyces sp. NRRL S-813 TaxID=1463919 RepID=UPI0004C0A6EC|nr:site-specific DNA-methyltransferase [Streptomyces sp. NRRL S-813]